MCTHEQPQLVGTAEGIRCRACGKVFNSFAELEHGPGGSRRARREAEDGEEEKDR